MDWRSAFISQAKSDFEIAELLSRTANVPLCHVLHYLQMGFEKLTKGMNIPKGSMEQPLHTHSGAVKFIQLMGKPSPLSKRFHDELGMNKEQRDRYLKGLLPCAQLIEELATALANKSGKGVNAEYPWVLPQRPMVPTTVTTPVEYKFASIPRHKLPKVLELARVLLQSCE